MSLVIVGSIALDSIETPYGSRDRAVGGSAVYAGLAASYFSSPGIVGVIGEDFPEDVLETLENHGVNLQGVKKEKGRTFFWKGRYHTNMNERDTLDTQLNVFENFNPVLPEDYRKQPFLFLGNIQPDLQMNVLNQMEEPIGIACDTMNLWINTKREDLLEVLKRIQILLINDSEAKLLSGESNLFTAINKIHDLGVDTLIVKKGEHGAVLSKGNILFFIPAFPVLNLKDPTGAGDTFAGGFMGYLAKSGEINESNLRKAVVYGTVMASFCVEDFSVDGLLNLSPEMIEERYDHFVKMMRFE